MGGESIITETSRSTAEANARQQFMAQYLSATEPDPTTAIAGPAPVSLPTLTASRTHPCLHRRRETHTSCVPRRIATQSYARLSRGMEHKPQFVTMWTAPPGGWSRVTADPLAPLSTLSRPRLPPETFLLCPSPSLIISRADGAPLLFHRMRLRSPITRTPASWTVLRWPRCRPVSPCSCTPPCQPLLVHPARQTPLGQSVTAETPRTRRLLGCG